MIYDDKIIRYKFIPQKQHKRRIPDMILDEFGDEYYCYLPEITDLLNTLYQRFLKEQNNSIYWQNYSNKLERKIKELEKEIKKNKEW